MFKPNFSLLMGSMMCALSAGIEVNAAPASKVFEIGLIFRMDDKLNGVELSKGIETAKTLFEKTHPGVQIKFQRFPHNDDLGSVVESAQKAINSHVPAVIGGELSEESFVLRDSFRGRRVVLVTPTSTNPEVTEGQPYVFRFSPSDQRVASDLARMTLRNLKPGVVGIINNVSSPYSNFLSKQFKATLEAEQTRKGTKVPIIEENIIGDTVNLEPQIQRFIKEKVTHVMIPAHPSEFFHFVTQARAKQYFPVFIGSDGWGGSENIQKRLINGSNDRSTFVAYRAWFWNEGATTSLGNSFRTEYFRKYRTSPQGFSGIGFDTAWTLMSAMNEVQNPKSGEQIQKSLASLKPIELVTREKFFFGADHSPSGGVHIYKIDGEGVHFWSTLN